jgi:tetratricopeptide (TPR) repeat protein/tRNA A-37 threonylcarbamoyl transferase component Bud32
MSTPTISVGQLVGHYRILEKIGGGGQGEVFRAHDERFDRDVALKVLPPKAFSDDAARKRFHLEAQAVGRLNHPNIATAFDFPEWNGIDFLVTEYVSGARLDEKMSHGPLSEETVLALGRELASGLEAAHHQGIIHRDLKPGNLRFTESGQLKILDFGLAELMDPSADIASAETISLTMTLTGTLPYMAPEQFDGICDQRTDLWAAGVVLYELATGKLPFPQTQLPSLKNAIRHEQPKRPTEVNPLISTGLETVILRALEKDPKRRYQTAKELHDDLGRVTQGIKVRRPEPLWRSAWALALLAGLLAVSALAVYHFWPQIQERIGRRPTDAAGHFRVLAVLPIDTGSQDAADNALVRGVAETVSAGIARGTNGQLFQVIPPKESSDRGVKTADAARREFGADRVLTVALQHLNDKIRITCSLIDPKTHQQMDARTLTGDSNDLFALEDNTVADVFVMLPPNARLEQPAPTEVHAAEPAAYEYYLRGRGYLLEYQKPENIDSAINEFEHALNVSPNYAPAYAGLGEAYWQGYKSDRGKQWLDKAKDNCEKALTAQPKLADGHTCLGNVYRARGDYDSALREIKQAIAINPTNVLSVIALGDTYDKLHNYSESEATYKRAITLNPNYWAVYNWAGGFYAGRARYSDAEGMFRKAVDLAPGNQRALYNLGAMYLLEGRYQEAIDALQHSIELRPTTSAYSNLGTAYFYLHHYPDAIVAYDKARALDQQDYLNWGNLGDALYWSPNRRPESAAAYKRAIELGQARLQVNPKDATVRAFVADYYAMLGDRHSATVELDKALTLAPQDPDVLFRAAVVYNQLGDQRQTLDWLNKAVAANFSRTTVRDTPDFDHLKSDPAFKAILQGN